MRRFGRSLWRLTLLGSLLALAAGCAADSPALNRTLLADRSPANHAVELTSHYYVHSPDVLELVVAGRPDWTGRYPIHADGRIVVDDTTFPRVDGRTVSEIGQLLAQQSGLPPEKIQVAVVEYNSQHLYVQSEAPGLERVVPYQGPETIVSCLQRVGGITARGAPHDIQVVRSHVADGRSPEIYHVDLEAILLKQDARTNVTLESFDQIYIGQSRRSCFMTCFPPWLRPFVGRCCGVGQP